MAITTKKGEIESGELAEKAVIIILCIIIGILFLYFIWSKGSALGRP